MASSSISISPQFSSNCLKANLQRAEQFVSQRCSLFGKFLAPLGLNCNGNSAVAHSSVRAKKKMVGPTARYIAGDDLPEDYAADDPSKTAPERRIGILMHPTSLPGPYGIGDLGEEAHRFLDWLKAAGCTVWQVLPLVPPGRNAGEDGSPYAGQDANCGNTLLISLDLLVSWGLLDRKDLPKKTPVGKIDFEAVAAIKDPLLLKAGKALVKSHGGLREEMEKFRKSPSISAWLEEAALFAAIDSTASEGAWWMWPEELRDRHPKALDAARKKHKDFIDVFIAQQFLFQRQWNGIHKYANECGIQVIGDMPIYVGAHSADVWANRHSFMLDEETGAPTMVSGVPPDAFSETGQLWGSPLYNWKAMAKDNYKWWVARMRRAYDLYDEFRIDHFRGLAGYWAVKAGAFLPSGFLIVTIVQEKQPRLMVGPREPFFEAIKKSLGKLEIIAEDLGVITSDVVALRKAINAPGMAILQFGFGGDSSNPHLPHNHEVDQVVYPGTHDNDTVLGWWKSLTPEEQEAVKEYFRITKEDDISWEFIRAAMSSVARTVIVPMQDVLGLDTDARMNIPATQAGNWGWRIGETGIFTKLVKEKDRFRNLAKYYNRLPRKYFCPI
ncbi:hypothetical protein R1sor_001812 [Riccia sorocarpa]|uniref:4-alpha-glucanotransferase n=1 Tax=Riccia sorocarpa TaxID=122646 RepID=A0ABD3GWZ2_9MARC